MKIGLLGTGFAIAHAAVYAARPDTEVVVFGRSPEKLAVFGEKFGFATTTDVGDEIVVTGALLFPLFNVGGGYRLTAGTAMPPLLLDDDEAVAIAICLRTAAAGSVTGIEEASVRALAKLEQVLPSRLRRRVTVLQEAAVAVPQSGPTADAQHLALIATPASPTRSSASPTVPAAAPRPAAATRVARTLTGTEGRRALLLVHAPAEQVADRVPAGLGIVEPVDEHTCRLLTGADSLEYLAYRVAVLGHDFGVLDPPELAARLRILGERVLRAATTAERLAADA